MNKPTGAQFEISVDGKPRSYRDTKAIAMEAAEVSQEPSPHNVVAVSVRSQQVSN